MQQMTVRMICVRLSEHTCKSYIVSISFCTIIFCHIDLLFLTAECLVRVDVQSSYAKCVVAYCYNTLNNAHCQEDYLCGSKSFDIWDSFPLKQCLDGSQDNHLLNRLTRSDWSAGLFNDRCCLSKTALSIKIPSPMDLNIFSIDFS